MNTKYRALQPHLILAAAILAATAVAVSLSGWWMMAGPAVLAVGVIMARAAEDRLTGYTDRRMMAAWIMVGAIFAASIIVGVKDTAHIATFLPIWGVTTIGGLRHKFAPCTPAA